MTGIARRARGRAVARIRQRFGVEESGAVLILTAFLLTIFRGMAAFAIDFGWLYVNGIRIQHGADAAALAGVVYEPDDQAQAYAQAIAAAAENGYDATAAGTTVTPVDFADDPTIHIPGLEPFKVIIDGPKPTKCPCPSMKPGVTNRPLSSMI